LGRRRLPQRTRRSRPVGRSPDEARPPGGTARGGSGVSRSVLAPVGSRPDGGYQGECGDEDAE
jgi:hypothetical protein